ncbi:RNA polymerase sigma-70 factor, ECF subfamily [Catalinimonas alkaloidigena]|uniref:RNA polymerase sigma-70 factor, ECF subfamily n=1 Tax=Catalinimonas alkaloidigena TaxID=1075417 RepID=A0A1G9SES3_9BACT|nr:RNA polymerase sigma-70 factor [Catalinimonas alkaloidigena]SDM33939.1 RNA polymerase sigma-70 factor, ECF subfamily [Catalinimonas alkaloidigena]
MEITLRPTHVTHETFNELFLAHWQQCFALAYRLLQDQQMAEDLVQEIFMDLWHRRRELSLQNPEAFLIRMIKNKAFTALSRTRLHERNLEILEKLARHPSPEEQYVAQELEELLHETVQELPPRCREVYQLKREEGLSTREIAERLCISDRTVEQHLYQANKLLRSNLKPVIVGLLLLSFS